MIRSRRSGTFRTAAVWTSVLALAALTAACGDDDDRSDAPGTDAPAVTDAPEATDAPETTDAPAGTDATATTSAPAATDAPASSDTVSEDEWAEIVAAAEDEGRVVLYSAQPPPALARIVDGFREAYPEIEIAEVRGPSGELLSRLEQERDSGSDGADVWITTELGWFADRSEEGALLQPAGPATNEWPAEYMQGEMVVAGLEPFIITYNTDLVENPPTSYQDLLAPEFKGRIATTELAATTLVAWYTWLEETEGEGFLEQLAAQNPRLYVGAVPLGQAVASGEVIASAFGVPTATQPLIDEGAPLAYSVPDPGLGIRYGMAALGWSQRPNAALVLVDWIMSSEGQQAWHGRGESASPLPGIEGSLDPDAIVPWEPADFPPEVVDEFTARWTEMFVG